MKRIVLTASLITILAALLVAVPACSSAPPPQEAAPPAPARPAWLNSPVRFEGSGWIVFIGAGEDRGIENARFKARAFAYQNMANECSFVPKGAIVDGPGYDDEVGIIHRAFAKVAVPAERCAAAKAAITPDDIRARADGLLQSDLRRYQEEYDPPEPSERPDGVMSLDLDSAVKYYTLKQRLALCKQDAVLSPATDATNTSRIAEQAHTEQTYEREHLEMVTEPRAYSDHRMSAYTHSASAVRDTLTERTRLANTYPTPFPETPPVKPPTPAGGNSSPAPRPNSANMH